MLIGTVRKHALALPETTEQPHHNFSSFRVRGKIFVTVPPDERHVHVFVGEEDRERAIALFPEYIEKLLWGAKVVGVRITLQPASAKVVKDLVSAAWRNKARPRLPGS
jgi:hypothetical protein